MRPYNIYILDFFLRIFYILISYLFCWIIFFNNIEILFLFEVFPFVSILSNKRFILVQVTQLINTIWFFCIFLCSVWIMPLIYYNIQYFFISSWYNYQLKVYYIFSWYFIFIFFCLFFFNHFIVVLNLLKFFFYCEIIDEYSLLKIEAEISLISYITWICMFKFITSFFVSIIFVVMHFVFCAIDIIYLYTPILIYKQILSFIIICICFFFIPPDFFLQLFLTVLIFISIEFSFFLACVKLYKKLKKFNAYFKTNIKNPS